MSDDSKEARLNELICDAFEAIEQVREFLPLFRAVLKATGSREQAIAAVKHVVRIEALMNEELSRESH